MNYQSFSTFDIAPPYYKDGYKPFVDKGNGIPAINEYNMTVQDIFRTPFLFTQSHHKNYKNMALTALKGIQCQSDLSKIYFSDKNIKRLQKKIKKEIFKRTKGEFLLEVDQEVYDLVIAMRATYIEYARNIPGQVMKQIRDLNKILVNDIVPDMITNIRQYYGYLNDINQPLQMIPQPINDSNAGRKTLPSFTSILF